MGTRRKRKTIWTLRNKLILGFLLVLLIPSLSISIATYKSSYNAMEKQLYSSANQGVTTANSVIEYAIASKIEDVGYLAERLDGSMIDGPNSPLIQPKLIQYIGLHEDAKDIFVGTPKGLMIRGVPKKDEGTFDPRTRPWYIEAMKQPGKVVITPVIINSSGIPVVIVSRTLSDQSGVIGVSLNLESVRKLASIKVGQEGYIVILDHTKKFVVHPTAKAGSLPQDNSLDRLYTAPSGNFNYMYEGQEKYLTYVTNEDTGWKIAGTFYQSEISDATAAMRYVTIIVLAASLVIALIAIFLITRSVLVPIRKLQKSAERISEGDLTGDLETGKTDEVGELSAHFQTMVDSLRTMIRSVRETTDRVSSSAEELAAGADQTTQAIEHVTIAIQEVAVGSERQLQSVKHGSVSMEGLAQQAADVSERMVGVSEHVKMNAESAQEGSKAATQAVQKMHDIDETVHDLGHAMDSLSERSGEIVNIISVISGIAKQTNLLALNASIEAARAGDHGKGFAVVATEVRKLAEESAKSATLISERIEAMQVDMNHALGAMQQARIRVTEGIDSVTTSEHSFAEISQAVERAMGHIHEITGVTQEMARGTVGVVDIMSDISHISDEAASNTESISAAAEQQLASIEEIASSTADLSQMAEELRELVGRFQIEEKS
ncbi:methyl-accepting chemotaxis protein [Paenibacillus polymyxa]|uniref:Chemotaxis protein n=1 Tax=Paenibacillus polymyxa (strain SC2) TaxID=886882 RepID=E3EAT7_PAEPS|nr:methyl-accepting chemotaxis protein [Paenibacillus polymyxa]ADO59001.2 chemotaxis protein [Paenibacillus polymyxa SC2]TKH33289.1 methyl-accepting chemotaxis protein [Paenibacillus polymyxa]WPQ56595.1 methyl-accepting chemotaxis protein [Paenibacillus polymyxa]